MLLNDGKFDVSRKVLTILILALVGLAAYLPFRIYEIWNGINGNYSREISVDGDGKAYVIPDTAEVTLGVTTDAKTSDVAIQENTKKINAVMEVLKKFNIDKKDIQTTGYYLNPKYDMRSEISGYTLNQTLLMKTKDFTKVGDILVASAKAGANVVGGISFTKDDLEAAKSEARAIAIAKAKEKAKSIADQAGFKLGKMVNYYEYYNYPYQDYGKGGGDMGGGAVPVIEPGQNEITITASLTFKLSY